MTSRMLAPAIALACSLALAACGDQNSGSSSAARGPSSTRSTAVAPATTSSAAVSCPDVPVPGHLAENVMATGLDCDATVAIANEAEGRGRAPYTSGGYACKPVDAAAGKTTYTCIEGDAKLTFLYG